jgi:hypothetical protein
MLARLLCAALVLVTAGALAPAARADDDDVHTRDAVGITATTATLTGVVDRGERGWYRFEYDTDRHDYDNETDRQFIDASAGDAPVSAPVTGLRPGTLHHFRLVEDRLFGDAGNDRTFTTAPATPTVAPAPPAPAAPAPAIPAPVAPAPLPVAAPEIGKTVNVAPVSGTVKVKVPGQAGFADLAAGGSVPVGALVDTRAGSVRLTSALGRGRTQAGTFHGGMFQVRQTATGKGMTDLVLRGGNFSLCPRRSSPARGRAAAVARRRPPVRRLWGRDRGGRFRTHGRNSVATVRGTRWVTTDTCAGTRTTVTEGAVAVRDTRRHRTVVVRKGHSYLARAR